MPSKIIDISWPITKDMVEYKDKKTIEIKEIEGFEQNKVRQTLLTFSTHVGTHIDAPSHFVENGVSIDKIGLERLVGDCWVLDFSDVEEKIGVDDLKKSEINQGDIILLKTKNSNLKEKGSFEPNFVYLDPEAAGFLVSKKVKSVGIDYLGIERDHPEHDTHIKLLKNGIPIIEGLRLPHVSKGKYFFCCLPLALQGVEAAPARAVLIEKISL